MNAFSLFSPAKINLFLAVTGRRADGFHDLVSLVAPLAWGDTLHVTAHEQVVLECDEPTLPVDESNLVLKASALFQAATGRRGGAHFKLEKRIPTGAGLGGGSSNAVAALRALNQLAGFPLDEAGLRRLAIKLGSDCALFLENAPVIMRGRGDVVERLDGELHARIQGRRILLFKPAFGVSTPWAYAQMAADPKSYLTAAEAENRLAAWGKDRQASLEDLVYNNMEPAVFTKYPALPTLYANLNTQFGLSPRMSGSGSASYVLLADNTDPVAVKACINEAWGPHGFVLLTALA